MSFVNTKVEDTWQKTEDLCEQMRQDFAQQIGQLRKDLTHKPLQDQLDMLFDLATVQKAFYDFAAQDDSELFLKKLNKIELEHFKFSKEQAQLRVDFTMRLQKF